MILRADRLKNLHSKLTQVLSPRFLQQGERGMSLIEIIIVVALLGTLMAYMVSNLIGQSEEAKKDQTKLAMGVIQQSLQMYRVHNNRYPTTDQGLKSLIENPGNAKAWRGPYIEANKLKDPWDGEFSYDSDGSAIKIISGGPNGSVGDEDDIVYPEQATAAGAGTP
jgi:general secretion pathway protein G